ncbi:MAG: hypothetical protein K0Q87_3106 [Neobacillus sp.]|jgi:hypothetical protein|nr:hypothetical protein [Neobacillus sp.]
MSKMTFEYFLRLHLKNEDESYRKGYEYAKRLSFLNSMGIEELREVIKSYVDVGIKDRDVHAFGFAQAIREMIWGRLNRDIIVA